MLFLNTRFRSIFDIIIDCENSSAIFGWRKHSSSGMSIFSNVAFLTKTKTYEKHLYQLKPFNLLKIKDGIEQSLDISNARIIKIFDHTQKLYGIRIIGYKGQYELFSESQDCINSAFEDLKMYCVLYHLTNEYNLFKIIGKGNFSRVEY